MSKLRELEEKRQDAIDACNNYDQSLIASGAMHNLDKVRADPKRQILGEALIAASTELRRYKRDYESRLSSAKEAVITASKTYCDSLDKLVIDTPNMMVTGYAGFRNKVDELKAIESEAAE